MKPTKRRKPPARPVLSAMKVPQYYTPGYGERFRDARLDTHRSLRAVMDETGIHRGTISRIEHEGREPGVAHRDTLAAYYGVRTEWLITGALPMRRPT